MLQSSNSALAGSLLLKYNASEARVVAARWFQAAREALPALAQSNPLPPVDINVAIANSLFANMTEAVSRLISSCLPVVGCRRADQTAELQFASLSKIDQQAIAASKVSFFSATFSPHSIIHNARSSQHASGLQCAYNRLP